MSFLHGLENLLLEFADSVLSRDPADLVNYAAEYFCRLLAEREGHPPNEDSQEYITSQLGNRHNRRGTVMGERYNPEEDDDDVEVPTFTKTDEQRERIKSYSAEVFLFRVLDDTDLGVIIDAMAPKEVKKGEIVIKQGDDGDFFYLIDKGNFDVYIKDENGEDKYISTYKGKGNFGELALLHNQPRAATVKAATDGFLWAVDRHTFNKLIVKHAFEKRRAYVSLLENVEQLKPLTDYERMQVADALIAKSFNEGDVIVQEGDEGDGMYFMVEGSVSVRKKQDDGEDREVQQLTRGQFFGELALVEHQPRSATIVALGKSKTAFLDVKAFERLLGPCIDIMKRHAAEAYSNKSLRKKKSKHEKEVS